ncbi:hypothetical protein [Halobacteriovorax sp. HLS]|uniref:hypothetical protein n=1 Tax=Halobacteriovorax sp. HLS TaxID=2234000 RepID=UPI000FDCD6D6|nr:hypothetical protein [Halobacteriovorax sp. HLS]
MMINKYFAIYIFLVFSSAPILANSATKVKLQACDLWLDEPNQRFLEAMKIKDDSLNKLANMRVFYKVSDQLLAKLNEKGIKEGGGAIDQWATESDVNESNQKEILEKWRKQFFFSTLLPSYSTLGEVQKALINNSLVEINNKVFPQEIKRQYEKYFLQAKDLSYSLIDSQKFDESTSKILKGRIALVQLNWFTQVSGTQYEQDPSLYLNTDIQFNPKYNIVSIGLSSARHIDGDTIIGKFIQQLAQAIDPCRWSIYYGDRKYPYEKVLSCLRGKDSIQAAKRDDSQIEKFLKEKKITKEQVNTLKKYPLCNSAFYPQGTLQREQVNIAFSDWFSAEAVAQASGISKHFREDLCIVETNKLYHAFPQNFERLVRIYFANPKVSELVGIKENKKIKYCKL